MNMPSLGMGKKYKLSDIIVSLVVPENVIGNYDIGMFKNAVKYFK